MPSPGLTAGICAAVAFTGIGGTVAYATLSAQSQLFGRTLQGPPEPDQVALTFDDGPNPAATPQLLEVLARHGVRATFFVIGDYVRREPGLARAIAAAGHVVGNHTMTHPWLPFISGERVRAELAGCNAAIEDVLGQRVEIFRPPHGALRPLVLRAARDLGLKTVQWNLICGDWTARSAAEVLGRLEAGIAANQRRGRGTNVVLHDGGQAGLGQPRMHTVAAVDDLLRRQAGAGLRYVVPPEWR